MTRRRALIRLTGVVAVLLFAAPPVATAQVGKVWRVGYLTNEAAEVANPSRVMFRQRLRELRYVEGKNIALEMRAAEGRVERFPALAAELVSLKSSRPRARILSLAAAHCGVG